MSGDTNGRPNDAGDYDGSHINRTIREALKDFTPEIAAGVRAVADYVPGRLRENGNGIPADGVPPKRRSPNGR